jgi:heme-degrading monooxygenase HmoA
MHMRLVRIEVKQGVLPMLHSLYSNRIIPALEATAGCRFAGLVQSVHHPEQCLSLTLWNTQEDARTYEAQGVFPQLMNEARPFLSESSEFTIKLSEDLNLEYVPVPNEPVIKSYPIAARSETTAHHASGGALWLRIVSLKILPGKLEEFKQLYAKHSIPALRTVRGCRYVYLLESADQDHEVLSVTSWESKQDAEAYEKSGLFEQLLETQKHTLSGLYQWKRSLGRERSGQSATSDDVMVEHYTVLIGKDFG